MNHIPRAKLALRAQHCGAQHQLCTPVMLAPIDFIL